MSDLEIKVIDNLQYQLLARLFWGQRTMTDDQWQQDKDKIISLCKRKELLLEEQGLHPLPNWKEKMAKVERKNEAQVHKMKTKYERKIEALQQKKGREEIKAKKAKDEETEKKVQEQGKRAQQKTKGEQKEQRKTKKEKRKLEKKQNQMEMEKIEREQTESTNSPPSTQLECCQTAAECLINDHLECLFRLTININ